ISARYLSWTFGSWLNRIYFRFLAAAPSFFLPALFADRARTPRFTRQQYLLPFFDHPSERQGPYTAAVDLIRYSPWYASLWKRAEELRRFPTLLIWGMEDRALGESALARWQEALPEARVARLSSAGRYLMDDMPVGTLGEMW